MAINLNLFKEGGALRKYVTKIGLLCKLDKGETDEELLAKLNDSVTISGKTEIAEAVQDQDDEGGEDTPVTPDEPVTPDKPVTPDEPVTPEDPDLPSVDDETIANFEYIHDEESWNNSAVNGVLKNYYEVNPTEDLWNSAENRAANYNDRVYEGTLDGESATCSVQWASDNAQKLIFSNGDYYAAIFYELEPKEIELFTDVELTTPAGKTFNATSVHYSEACTHSYQGAVNAPESTLPWIAIDIPKGFNGIVKCVYKTNNPKYPFGEEARTFNGGYGIVAVKEITTSSSFDASKLVITLIAA